MINDFDPNIHLDNMKASEQGQNEPEQADPEAVEDADAELRSPVRLAAKSLISHFINHLFHFPMETGASSLSSMVSENDDNPWIKASDELGLEGKH